MFKITTFIATTVILIAGASCSWPARSESACDADCRAALMSAREKAEAEKLRAEAEKERAQAEAAMAMRYAEEYKTIAEKLRAAFAPAMVDVQLRDGMMVLRLPDEVLFDFGSSAIKPQGEDVLYSAAQILKDVPAEKHRTFLVVGHTDNRPIKKGTRKYKSNLELSSKRSVSVVNYLMKQGVSAEILGVAGFGHERPIASNDTAEGRQMNRRTEIILVPTLDDLPSIPDYTTPRTASDGRTRK